jgi:hypothetical protein
MTTKGSGLSPPLLPDDEKFDGTNYLEWRDTILMACRLRGARGYLTGTISQPESPGSSPSTTSPTPTTPAADAAAAAAAAATTTTTTMTETPWTSTTPTWEEWDTRDAWCHIAIRQNVKNPTGLGLKTDGSAAEAWKSLKDRYQTSTDLARVYAQRELRSARLNDGDDFPMHLADLHTKHKRANAVGAKIDDADFREIILASLPPSWDNIISTLHTSPSSIDTIIRLEQHWSRVNRTGRVSAPGTSAIALKASMKLANYQKKVCANPICGRKGHTIEECYWKGGGKEGQFPPGFGQRGGATGSAAKAAANSSTPPIANAAVVETAYALAAVIEGSEEPGETVKDETVDTDDEIPELIDERTLVIQSIMRSIVPMGPIQHGIIEPTVNETQKSEYTVTAIPEKPDWDGGTVAMSTGSTDILDTLTYADSGASNHCFVNKSDFSSYEPFTEHQEGQAASRGARFKIHGKGTVIKRYKSGNLRTSLTLTNCLHTPDFAANLISISRFDDAGFEVVFGKGVCKMMNPSGEHFLSVNKEKGMYVFDEIRTRSAPHTAMPAKSHEKPTSIDQWHRRFCHFGKRTIKEMASKNLVDGLQIVDGKESLGMCEDCIYGKQASRPYDERVVPEKEVLERVHVDLWGPARVQSSGGARYAMIFTDGGSSFRKEYFLAEKSGDAVLQALKHYKVEAELHTGKKMKRLRLDMAKEFLTHALTAFCKDHGIIIETPAPYAHSANGVPERTNRTVIEGVRSVRCDSGLAPTYWADILAAVIYTLNLMPSRRHPGQIPAEKWFGKRQDVSHLRSIGSAAYAKVPKEINPSKLDSTSIKYTLIGYYGRDAYKLLDRNTGIVVKARNVVFEEGSGHHTLFDQKQLRDEPMFEIEDDHVPGPQHLDNHADAENAQAPIDRVPEQAPAGRMHEPQPIAPRHRPTDVLHTNPRPLNVQLFNTSNPAPALPPLPRRSTRLSRPTTGALDSAESSAREAEARDRGDDWANDSQTTANLAYPDVITQPGYDMDLDAAEFQQAHMATFQADLDEYMALLVKADKDTYLPRSYEDAMQHADLWLPPMQAEMEVMRKRGVFSKVERPVGRKVIGLKWIFGFKYDVEGEIARRKARLVAQGFNQIPGVDFDQTYASVARLESMRMCIAIIAHLGLHLWQIDFVAAYLNSVNKFEVYTGQAPGFVAPGEEHLVYRANKTVYGMMAGAHDWEEELSGTYDALGYYQSLADPCVRHRVIDGQYTLNVTYTDDVIGGSTTIGEEMKAIGELEGAYEIKRVEEEAKGRFILGMSMQRDEKTGAITLSQRPYFERILKRFGMAECNPKHTPLPSGIELTLDDCATTDEQKSFMADKPYREVLGSIMWAQVATRPDLSFAVNLLARFQINPGPAHWKALMHVLAYIKATLHYKLTYHRGTQDGIKPVGYVDADYAGDLLDTGRSTGAYIFMMAGGPVSWSSKRQETVALSTTEAEYMAMSRACQQAVWMYSFMREAGLEQEAPAILYNDNTGSIALTESKKGHKKAKHIHIRYHYIRERVSEGDVRVFHVPSADNLADILTKPLPRVATENQAHALRLFD